MPPLPDDKSYFRVISFRGTRGYVADEHFDGELSMKLDVFSLGVVSKMRCIIVQKLIIIHYMQRLTLG